MPTSVLNNVKSPQDIGAAAGTLYRQDSGLTVTSRAVSGGAQQVQTAQLSGATSGVTYTLTIAGTACTFTAGGADTTTTITTGLTEAINNTIGASNRVFATDSTDTTTITGRLRGETITITGSVSSGADTFTMVTTTAASDANALYFGTFAEASDYTGVLGTTPGAARAGSGTYTAQITTTPDIAGLGAMATSDQLSLTVTGDFDGLGRKDYSCAVAYVTSEARTIKDAMYALNAQLPASSVVVTEASDALTFTAEVAGVGFTATGGVTHSGVSAVITMTTGTPNATPDGAGFIVKAQTMEMDTSGNGYFSKGETPSCLTGGRINVRLDDSHTISALSDPVFVRTSVAGTEVLGALRSSADGTDCLPLSAWGLGARWLSTGATGLNGNTVAGLEVWPI